MNYHEAADKREKEDETLLKEVLEKIARHCPDREVTIANDKDGATVITIKSGDKIVTRREHTFPEVMRKQGD